MALGALATLAAATATLSTGPTATAAGKCGNPGVGFNKVSFYNEAGYVAQYYLDGNKSGEVWRNGSNTPLAQSASTDLTTLGLKDNDKITARANWIDPFGNKKWVKGGAEITYCQGSNRTANIKTWGTIFDPQIGWN
ncbi:hypothetical protein SNOUR_01145 [Streptomyces noursei ATCC 11455]|uniref:hypothetical protein n=1 Tax=Streptomyces noursei TaxID=1971 RepID=UPI00081CDC4A|nr:hypothetical protein SNOUR_01145 [Streptomyces noursei ATCC 11455]